MNIGKLIKTTAVIILVVFIILFAFLGGAFFDPNTGVFIGALLGLCLGWLQFVLLYGFGKIIDDVHQIRKKTCGDVAPAPKTSQPINETPALWECPLCGRQNPVGKNVCCNCGTELGNSTNGASNLVIAVKADGSWVCPFCDTHNTPESKFCRECGIEIIA
ncbi:MAG: hypothetical protein E7466_06565 [Ruminococcaceae bacterium]|nr:hypothetical protein [Oscillospiraceae bacterium]